MNKTLKLLILLSSLTLYSCQQQELAISGSSENEIRADLDDAVMASSSDINSVIEQQLKDWGRTSSRATDFTLSTIYSEGGEPSIYVINFANDNGWMLISAAKTYHPILAFSENGVFDIQDAQLPDALKGWIADAKSSISLSKTLPEDSIAKYKYMWDRITFSPNDYTNVKSRAEGDITDEEFLELQEIVQNARMEYEAAGNPTYSITEDVTNDPEYSQKMIELAKESIYPLYDHEYERLSFIVEYNEAVNTTIPNMVETTWEQGNGFNKYFIKSDGSGRFLAGCGAVAIGQLFYYHKYPTTYNWDSMLTDSATSECASMLYDIAKCAGCDLTHNNSAMSVDEAYSALSKNKYACDTLSEKSTTPSKIAIDMNCKRPVMMAAKYVSTEGDSVGHIWLATGMRTTQQRYHLKYITLTNYKRLGEFNRCNELNITTYYYYMNWGWGNKYDGFYINDNLIIPNSNGNTALKRWYFVNVKPK
jgi:hypothetical protein